MYLYIRIFIRNLKGICNIFIFIYVCLSDIYVKYHLHIIFYIINNILYEDTGICSYINFLLHLLRISI